MRLPLPGRLGALLLCLPFPAALVACEKAFSAAPPSEARLEAGAGTPDGKAPIPDGAGAPPDARPTRNDARAAAHDGGIGHDAASAEPPLPTSGLLLWLRADRGITESGGHVTIWEDQSGNHADALQTASNLRPVLVPDGISGRPAVEFDGVDDYLRLPPGFTDFSAGVSMFAIVQASSANACAAFTELSNGSEIDDVSFGLYNGSILYEVFDHDHSTGTFEYDVPQEVAVIHRPDLSLQVRRNGGSEGEDSFDLPAVIQRTETFVGRTLYGNCTTFAGRIAELLVYDRAVADRELLDIEAALTKRYACCAN